MKCKFHDYCGNEAKVEWKNSGISDKPIKLCNSCYKFLTGKGG